MRINENLEKTLMQLEQEENDNVVKLLDIAKAFEEVYKFINTSFIADEKGFAGVIDDLECTKERYDAIKGKTIYEVKRKIDDVTDVTINVEVANNGEISFGIASTNSKEAESLIDEINSPGCELLELIRMNADVSFFTENRELVFSTKPYLALKMGNFVEGDKAVLVYREEAKENDLNSKTTGLKYIRVDQIEGYLKNIKIDERRLPVLAYAYYGIDSSLDLEDKKYNINESTYPKITPDKVKYYTDPNYSNKLSEFVLSLGFGGGFCGGILGVIIGAASPLPLLPCILVGAGIPIATSVAIFNNGSKNYGIATNKEALISEARLETYRALKEVANANISYQEKEFTRKRAKNNKVFLSLKKGEKMNPIETIREVKTLISGADNLERPLYEVQLEQILNAYQQSTTKTRENELVEELYLLTDEIQNGKTTTIADLINMTIKKVTSLSDKVNVNDTLQTFNSLNSVIDYIADRNNNVYARKGTFKRELIRNYFEVMLQSKANEEETSIETLATIDSLNRSAMVNYLIEFSKRVKHFDDEQKSKVASTINFVCTSNEPSEVKIYKSIDLISKNDLTIDLLGKKIQAKTKVKVEE